MNRIDNYIRISQLIAKEVNYGLEEEEQLELNQWIDDCEENRQLYDRIRNRESFLEWDQQMHKVDLEEGWKCIDEAINPNRRMAVFQAVLRYAAVVMIPLFLAGVGYYLYNDITNLPQPKQVAKLSKPKPKARLILADGKKVNLDNVEVAAMKEKDGTHIEKGAGVLKYQAGEKEQEVKPLYNTVEIPKGGEYQLNLSDGTKVYLNSMSSLKFPVRFSGKTRDVILKGEAYFEVSKDAKHPFVVNVAETKVEVLGTSFNVKAYDEETEIVTTLVEGSVKVKTSGENAGSLLLKPGQQAVVNEENGMMDMREVDVALFTSWKDGVFLFKNQRMEDIMMELARWYDVKVFYQNPSVKELCFGGHFNRSGDISSIMEMFELTRKVDAKINGKTIVISEK
ncbi:MAG: FecR domain-containing protein [Marinifilaceae bacterium]